MINKLIIDQVNAKGKSLTTAQWFVLNGYINMEKYMILEMLQHVKPEAIYDIMEQMQKELKEKKK